MPTEWSWYHSMRAVWPFGKYIVQAPAPGSFMSGTFWVLAPRRNSGNRARSRCGSLANSAARLPVGEAGLASSAGVSHWWGVPSLIQGVSPPCRWMLARFWV